MELFLVFIFGSCMASFGFCLAERMMKGEDCILSSSHCNNCNYKLKAYEKLPILSFLILKGKCPHCGYQIPIAYPLGEFLMGIMYLFLYQEYQMLVFLILAFVTLLLLVLSYIDCKTFLLPDILTILLFVMGIFFLWAMDEDIIKGIVEASIILVLMIALSLLTKAVCEKEVIGDGDLKLIAVLSLYLGIERTFLMLLVACIFAIIIFLLLKKEQLPFGPIIAFSFFLLLLVA
ncbi:MAG: prepilin peptidase [Erysipelotrichaceae bacterium]|nr:prepilin peptidase [Erysipelotrichaceae bacterium]